MKKKKFTYLLYMIGTVTVFFVLFGLLGFYDYVIQTGESIKYDSYSPGHYMHIDDIMREYNKELIDYGYRNENGVYTFTINAGSILYIKLIINVFYNIDKRIEVEYTEEICARWGCGFLVDESDIDALESVVRQKRCTIQYVLTTIQERIEQH